MESNSVGNYKSDNKIGRPCSRSPIFTSWYVRHAMRYNDGWIGHSIPVRQLIYALNPHKRELNAFSPVSHTRFGFLHKVMPSFYVHICGGRG